MATVEVSTWAELASTISSLEYSSENITIKLMADIDINDVAPEGTSVTCSTVNWASHTVTLDGEYTDMTTGEKKRRTIKNLRTPLSSSANLFYFSRGGQSNNEFYFKFKDIDFQNIILASGNFIDWDINKVPNFELIIENCRFVGSRNNYYLCGKNVKFSCNKCYFDIPWNGAGQSNLSYTSLIPKALGSNGTSAIAIYCRFKESYGNWTWNDSLTYESTDRFFSCSYFKMSGCRIDGNAQICGVTDSNDKGAYYFPILCKGNASYAPLQQNVFDVSLTAVRNSATYDADNVLYGTFTGVVKNDIKYGTTDVTTMIDNRINFDGATYTAPIFATPNQMKDPSYLDSQGFDIIVPST